MDFPHHPSRAQQHPRDRPAILYRPLLDSVIPNCLDSLAWAWETPAARLQLKDKPGMPVIERRRGMVGFYSAAPAPGPAFMDSITAYRSARSFGTRQRQLQPGGAWGMGRRTR